MIICFGEGEIKGVLALWHKGGYSAWIVEGLSKKLAVKYN